MRDTSTINAHAMVAVDTRFVGHVCRKLNSACSTMLSRITGREFADEARMPSINVLQYYAPETSDGAGSGTFYEWTRDEQSVKHC